MNDYYIINDDDSDDINDEAEESIFFNINKSNHSNIINDNEESNQQYFHQRESYDDKEKNKFINLKNIYNISKALSHDNTIDWKLLPSNYIISIISQCIKNLWFKFFSTYWTYIKFIH